MKLEYETRAKNLAQVMCLIMVVFGFITIFVMESKDFFFFSIRSRFLIALSFLIINGGFGWIYDLNQDSEPYLHNE